MAAYPTLKKAQLRFRQIPLDFHSSEHIESIGSNVDPDEFAETLVKAKVNSITCFARCHHGWLYFDSKNFPESKHPHLKNSLLSQQIEPCHNRGIRVPTTVQWDHYTATRHPDIVRPVACACRYCRERCYLRVWNRATRKRHRWKYREIPPPPKK